MKNCILPQRAQEILHHMNVRVICNTAACTLRFGFDGLTFRGWVDFSLTARAHAVGWLHATWVDLTPPPSTDCILYTIEVGSSVITGNRGSNSRANNVITVEMNERNNTFLDEWATTGTRASLHISTHLKSPPLWTALRVLGDMSD